MRVFVDSGFAQGATHPVCQDYARAGVAGTRAYGLVADGCSSSPDTDVGARGLVLAAERLLQQGSEDLAQAVEHVPPEPSAQSRDATLASLVAHEGAVCARFFGDGGYLALERTGTLVVGKIEFVNGYPLYLNYSLPSASGRRAAFFQQPNAAEARRRVLRVSPDGTVSETEESFHAGGLLTQESTFSFRTFSFVAVVSDGLFALQRLDSTRGRQWVAVDEATTLDFARSLTTVVSPSGRFVERRLRHTLDNLGKIGVRTGDDISIAAVYVPEPPEPVEVPCAEP